MSSRKEIALSLPACGKPAVTEQDARGGVRCASAYLLAVVLIVPFLAGSASDDAMLIETRRRRIENMTQSDLNRLKRNYDRFLKLSPERRDALCKLDEELQKDTKSGGHLQKLLEDYNQWLSKLSPFEREQLQKIDDPVERAKRVLKMREQQKEQRVARAHMESFPLLATQAPPVLLRNLNLGKEGLDAVTAVSENTFLSGEAKEKLPTSLKGRARHLRILSLTMLQMRKQRQAVKGQVSGEEALIAAMIEAIPEAAIKERLQAPGNKRRRGELGHLVGRALLQEWWPEIEGTHISQDEIAKFTEEWLARVPEERQEAQRLRLKTGEGKRLLQAQMASQKNPNLKMLGPVAAWLMRGFGANGFPGGGLQRPKARPSEPSAG